MSEKTFCAKCGGILLGAYPNPKHIVTTIAGKRYHAYCGGKVLEELIDAEIHNLDVLLAKKRLAKTLKGDGNGSSSS